MSEFPAPATSPSEVSGGSGPVPIPELIELGQRLRRAREGRGIGVAELADRLHLAPEQLTALESGDRSHLHEPVFVIAQAKRVAQALGVDVSEQVESLRHSRLMQRPATAPPAAGSAPPAPATIPTTVATASPSATAPASRGAATDTRLRTWPVAAAIAALTLLLGVLAAQALRHWGQPGSAARPGVPAPSRPEGASSAAPTAAPGVLLLRSDEPSWVEVRDGSGQVLFSGTLEKEARFRLGDGLRVLAGRPDLVTATVGREAPRRLGTISEVDWQDFAAPAAGAPPASPASAPAP